MGCLHSHRTTRSSLGRKIRYNSCCTPSPPRREQPCLRAQDRLTPAPRGRRPLPGGRGPWGGPVARANLSPPLHPQTLTFLHFAPKSTSHAAPGTHRAPGRPWGERAVPRGCGDGGRAGLTARPGRPGPRPAPRPSPRPEPAPQQPEKRKLPVAGPRRGHLPYSRWMVRAPRASEPGSRRRPSIPNHSAQLPCAPTSRPPARRRSRKPLTRHQRCLSCRCRRRRCPLPLVRASRLPAATPPPPRSAAAAPPTTAPPATPLAIGRRGRASARGAPTRPSRSRQWSAGLSFRGACGWQWSSPPFI